MQAIPEIFVKEEKLIALVDTFVAYRVNYEESEVTQHSVLVASLPPPPRLGDWSSSEKEWKSLQREKLPYHMKSSTALKSDDRETWSVRCFNKDKYEWKNSASENMFNPLKLTVIFPTDIAFVDELDYRIYLLQICYLCQEKRGERTQQR